MCGLVHTERQKQRVLRYPHGDSIIRLSYHCGLLVNRIPVKDVLLLLGSD